MSTQQTRPTSVHLMYLLRGRVLALELFTTKLPAQARPLGILGETQAQSCLFREGTPHSSWAVDLGTAEQEAALGDTPTFPSTGEMTSLHKLVTSGTSLALHSQNFPEEGGLEVLCVNLTLSGWIGAGVGVEAAATCQPR